MNWRALWRTLTWRYRTRRYRERAVVKAARRAHDACKGGASNLLMRFHMRKIQFALEQLDRKD